MEISPRIHKSILGERNGSLRKSPQVTGRNLNLSSLRSKTFFLIPRSLKRGVPRIHRMSMQNTQKLRNPE